MGELKKAFGKVSAIIINAKKDAYRKVNEELINMYWNMDDLSVKKLRGHQNPSVGLILCASKNDEVVEYAMSRSMSPMLVSEYKLQLPDKKLLREKLQELVNIPEIEER